MATKKDVRFSYDFANQTIVGTKASFNKAAKGYGPIYEELAAKMAERPTFSIVIVPPKKPARDRETYKGMDIPFMRNYLEMKEDEKAALKLEKVITFAKNQKKKPYPLAKKYFLKPYTNEGKINFDFAKAKAEVEAYLISKTEAAKNTASTTENKSSSTTILNPASLDTAEGF